MKTTPHHCTQGTPAYNLSHMGLMPDIFAQDHNSVAFSSHQAIDAIMCDTNALSVD